MNRTEREFELPFYVNETSPAATRSALEHELDSDAALARELRELRGLRDALVEIEAGAPAAPASLLTDVMAKIGPPGAAPQRSPLPVAWLRGKGSALWGFGLGAAACAALFLVHPEWPPQSAVSQHFGEDTPIVASGAGGAVADHSASAVVARSGLGSGETGGALAKPAEPASQSKTAGSSADESSATARQLARTGAIGLIVPDVTSALAKIQRLTQQQFGALTALQDDAPSTPGGKHTAQATVSVPDDRFISTLDALAVLGGVTSRSVTTEDLTDSIVDNEARLRNLRHEEGDLLRIMDRSGKIQDVLDVEQQLASTRQSIEELDAQTKSMHRRVAYATISIDLSDEKAVPVAVPGPLSRIGDAWRAAVRQVGEFSLWLAAQAFVLIVFLPYLALIGFGAYLVRRRLANRG